MTEELTLEAVRGRIVKAIQRTITGTEHNLPVGQVAAVIMDELRAEFEAMIKTQHGLAANPDYMVKPQAPALVYVATDGSQITLDRIDWSQRSWNLGGRASNEGRELAILRALLQWSTQNLEDSGG